MKALSKASKIDTTYTYNEVTGKYLRLYTCPDNVDSAMIVLYVSNLSTGNADISVSVKRNSTIIPFLKNKTISAKDFLHIYGGYVVLEAGDEVIAYGATASFSIIATFEETTKLTQSASGVEPTAITV